MVLLITKETARMMASNRSTKEKIREYIDKNCRARLAVVKEKFLDNGTATVPGGIPSWVYNSTDLKGNDSGPVHRSVAHRCCRGHR